MPGRSGARNPGASRGLLLGLAVFAVGAAGFALGWYVSHAGLAAGGEGPAQLRQALDAARRQGESAERELAALRTRGEVDRQSLEIVRREMVAQKQHITELEEDLRFYRSLMSPEGAPGQVQIREPEIVAMTQEGQYAYRLVLHQEAVKHQLIRGTISLGLEGERGGETEVLPLAGEGDLAAVKFRYFQEFAGSFTLPRGFEPAKVFVQVEVSKPRKMEVREVFAWPGIEESIDVGE
jgi:hypothetical protein